MIKTGIGEYAVGAYLKVIKKCDFIDYNARPPVGGFEGVNGFPVLVTGGSKRICHKRVGED